MKKLVLSLLLIVLSFSMSSFGVLDASKVPHKFGKTLEQAQIKSKSHLIENKQSYLTSEQKVIIEEKKEDISFFKFVISFISVSIKKIFQTILS